MSKRYHVYIMGSTSGVLYVGSSSDLRRRVWQHRVDWYRGFSGRYRVDRLLYYEEHLSPASMVRRERQLKGWVRRRKVALSESGNAGWRDLAEGWFDGDPSSGQRGRGGGG
ncbi:MAG: GIY-YIG nuclease family protein [Gemmatimonadales bacterium]